MSFFDLPVPFPATSVSDLDKDKPITDPPAVIPSNPNAYPEVSAS